MVNELNAILELLRSLYLGFPSGVQGYTLLVLRVGIGFLFMLHGYPKLTHLKQWSEGLGMPILLCLLSALSMFLGGFCLMAGFLTPFDCLVILASMVFALVLDIVKGLPFVAMDPYQIPEGEYEGPNGKGEPPSQEKAFIYILILGALAILGPGAFSLDAYLLSSF